MAMPTESLVRSRIPLAPRELGIEGGLINSCPWLLPKSASGKSASCRCSSSRNNTFWFTDCGVLAQLVERLMALRDFFYVSRF